MYSTSSKMTCTVPTVIVLGSHLLRFREILIQSEVHFVQLLARVPYYSTTVVLDIQLNTGTSQGLQVQ